MATDVAAVTTPPGSLIAALDRHLPWLLLVLAFVLVGCLVYAGLTQGPNHV